MYHSFQANLVRVGCVFSQEYNLIRFKKLGFLPNHLRSTRRTLYEWAVFKKLGFLLILFSATIPSPRGEGKGEMGMLQAINICYFNELL
jgi:hypothetical protein